MAALVVALGVVAALLYSLSDFFEQRAAGAAAAQEATGKDPEPYTPVRRIKAAGRTMSGALRRMVRDRVWLLGWLLGTIAYLVQAVALHFGSISVVQALQVSTLLFAIPLSAVGRPVSPAPRDWMFAGLVCVGLAAFLLGRGTHAAAVDQARGRVLVILVVVAIAVVALVLAAALSRGAGASVLLALAAGAGFACSATLVKITSDDLVNRGVAATAVDWPGYVLALATLTGLLLQQTAFTAGRLATATTAMIVMNPLLGTVIATWGFREPLPSSPARLTALAAGGALVVVGVWGLARSPLLKGGPATITGTRAESAGQPAPASNPRRTAAERSHDQRASTQSRPC